jgi:chromosome segregation protein
MRLKSLTLKGFKSFPDRTRLDFGPGVSVVVGPNGSGKSNVTDAVLWAMGEQSPLAIRGQSMQDVIFGGGRGIQARSSAEVEIVLDNSDGTVDLPLSEISIQRRLDRNGEGGYRLNGARCRLSDVIEVLSDTGLGKETHSVISQGRVEAIVTSKPRDRRLLIEEAAGLGKHRKRRRRAQLKLDRTQENLDRVLDVEREARTRLRPLKRQAEAAELHERLERQLLEARWTLACETLRARGQELGEAETRAAKAREQRELTEAELQAVVARRGQAESALAQRTERHDAMARRAYEIRSARERLTLRGEQAQASALMLAERAARIEIELGALTAPEGHGPGAQDANADAGVDTDARDGTSTEVGTGMGTEADTGAKERTSARSNEGTSGPEAASLQRIRELERELQELEREREQELEREIANLQSELAQAGERVAELTEEVERAEEAHAQADLLVDRARAELRSADTAAQQARREAARVGAELAAANQFLSSHARYGSTGSIGARALSDALQVRDGYELALAAALGGRLDAALAHDLPGANALLDSAGPDGASALLAGEAANEASPGAPVPMPGSETPRSEDSASASASGPPPAPGAIRLIELVYGPARVRELAGRLLGDAWVVERLEDVADGFTGIASTRSGRVLFAAWGEVRQVGEGGAERVLARRNERDRLIATSETAVQAEQAAAAAVQASQRQMSDAEDARGEAEEALRESERELAQVGEAERQAGWLIEQRRNAPEQGPLAVRRAQLQGELAAERRQAERIVAERAQREERIARLRARHANDTALAPNAQRLAATLASVAEAAGVLLEDLEQQLARDRDAGEQVAAELRDCAREEAEIQSRLRTVSEQVTATEVSAQRLRDQTAEAHEELRGIAERLERLLPGASSGSGEIESQGDDREESAREAQDQEPRDGELPVHEPEDHEPGDSELRRLEPAAMEGEVLADKPTSPEEKQKISAALGELQPLSAEEAQALESRVQRLTRRREQLGPVNPLAQEEYAQALEHVEELEGRRADLETALRELRTLIKDTDQQIADTFAQTFAAAAQNFEELVGDVFPGGSGRLRLVRDEQTPRPVLGGQSTTEGASGEDAAGAAAEAGVSEAAADAEAERETQALEGDAEDVMGVEIEITPAGKSTKRLSLLSGGEKSMTALAFLFAVFLARPCPFYILDEVEAALDDLNLDRFLALLRRYSGRAQFIVITHQKRTMEAADWLYGVSMGGNGVSKVLSRRLPPEAVQDSDVQNSEGTLAQVGGSSPTDTESEHSPEREGDRNVLVHERENERQHKDEDEHEGEHENESDPSDEALEPEPASSVAEVA